ncbi:MAG: DNA polymerase III subunit gamma/tau, partial [Desulfobacterales bacterium]|nr:DNA polymerase III subunit gamma/tau [Desulfobacterales bacterium]
MSYQVLALKYRPQTFDDVVGQGHVTTTLSNAIQAERVAHAILFTGPRGTGKTTIARILAKALNCQNGPTPTPCNNCKTCTDIIDGHCSDVFEIDGASNNSVDQIRDLRENVTYMPASSPYKIYIIDEVHMLSTAAFNALLKTLEEPPSHVKFIFATTEVHKIPATILSRCQRHDLGRIPLEQISSHLGNLCSKEGFSLSPEGLDLIAQEADGSIRDSLSLLDRILSAYPEKEISYAQVVEGLGVIDRQLMFDISTAVFQKNGAAIITAVEAINDAGMDLKKFYDDIVLHFRNLNVIKLCGPENSAVNLTEADKGKIHQEVTVLPQGYIGILLQNLLADAGLVKFSAHTRTAVETILLKLLQVQQETELDNLVQKIETLTQGIHKKFADGSVAPGQPRPVASVEPPQTSMPPMAPAQPGAAPKPTAPPANQAPMPPEPPMAAPEAPP